LTAVPSEAYLAPLESPKVSNFSLSFCRYRGEGLS
jgi:hypothetical protein